MKAIKRPSAAQKRDTALILHMQHQHENPPAGFNPAYRKGLGEAVSREFNDFCANNPGSSQERRKEEYARIHARLSPRYPTAEELGTNIRFERK